MGWGGVGRHVNVPYTSYIIVRYVMLELGNGDAFTRMLTAS